MRLHRTLLICHTSLLLCACAGTPPTNLGYLNGQFSPCPPSPNCVSSFAEDDSHKIDEIQTNLDPNISFQTMIRHLSKNERVSIKTATFPYIHAEFASRLFGFVDDVEFYFNSNTIQLRSASRLGYSDLGVNRERIESIRLLFNENQ